MKTKKISFTLIVTALVLCLVSVIFCAAAINKTRVGLNKAAGNSGNVITADASNPKLIGAMEKKERDKRDTVSLNKNDGAKTVTVSGGRYTFTLSYNNELVIKNLNIDGKEMFGAGDGIYVTAKTAGGLYSSANVTGEVTVTAGGNDKARTVSATYSDDIAEYTVTVTAELDDFTVNFKRKVKGETTFVAQAFPAMQFEQNAVENIRWLESGSNFWVDGKASKLRNNITPDNFKADNKVKRSMDEINFVLLSSFENNVALKVSGISSNDNVAPPEGREHARGRAVEVDRVLNGEKRSLLINAIMAAPNANLKYATGNEDWGWYGASEGQKAGSVRPSGTETVFKPVTVPSSSSQDISLTFTPSDYEDHFDLGEMYGINEELIAHAVNNYARMMLLGKNVGSAQEEPHFYIELPALQMHWNTALSSIFGDDVSMNTQKWALKNIASFLMGSDGHIRSPYPGVEGNNWGYNYPSMQTNYVTAIADCYGYTGDEEFALALRSAAEKSMEYFENTYFDKDANLVCNPIPLNPNDNKNLPYLWESHNDYWEKSVGTYNALLTVEYYEALNKLAELETVVYNDSDKAQKYLAIAAKVKETFNKDKSDGGCFVPEQNAFYYGSANYNVSYLPVQATAIRTGIVSRERAEALARQIERVQSNFNMGFHVMNVRDLKDDSIPASQGSAMPDNMMVGENGGWYGAPDAEWYSAFPVLGDRGMIPYYINESMNKFGITGFTGATCFKRDGITPADDGWYTSMPNMVLPVWGLYTYGYGFRSGISGLEFAPFIDESMIGSKIDYRWRGKDIIAQYNGLYDFTLSFNGDLPVTVEFINQTPHKTYTVNANGAEVTVTADSNGTVSVAANNDGRYCLNNPDSETLLEFDGENIFALNAVRPSSTMFGSQLTRFWAEQLTDGNVKGDNGYWQPDNSDSAPMLTVVNGKRYTVSTVKLYTGTGKYSFVLEGSDELGGEYKEIKTVNGVTPAKSDSANVITVKANASFRYWRIRFTGMKNSDIKIYEISAK